MGAIDAIYGDIPWWPGTPDEVCIGAVLTQQTRWQQVVLALKRLKEAGIVTLSDIHHADPAVVEEAVRCTGFYRVKTRRLMALASHIINEYGGLEGMGGVDTATIRAGLLDVPGIGAETADSILCYALKRRSFVVDAYTERICACAGIPERKGQLKALAEDILPPDNAVYRRCHAQFVEYAKEYCGAGRCAGCVIPTLAG
jgi:endonuclease-3 related protein